MKTIILAISTAYALPMIVLLCLELTVGPVSPALAVARAILWPLFLVTGIPHGQLSPSLG